MKLKKIYLFPAFAFLIHTACEAQSVASAKAQIRYLSSLYQNGTINKKAYLDTVFYWLGETTGKGIYFSTDTMISYLSLYKELASGDTAFSKQQCDYYAHLANNAGLQGNTGECIYFLEKYDRQNLISRKTKSYSALALKCRFFRDRNNYKKVIAVYETNLDYISSVPRLIEKDSIKREVAVNSLVYYDAAVRAYADAGDSVKLSQTINLAEKVRNAFLKKYPPEDIFCYLMNYHVRSLYFYKYFDLLNDMPRSRQIMEEKRTMLYGDTSLFKIRREWTEAEFLRTAIRYFLKEKNRDSAAFYLTKFRSLPSVTEDNPYLLLYTAEKDALTGRFDSAYFLSKRLGALKDSSIVGFTNELDGLLTAYIQAENNKEELLKAEYAKKQKTLLMIAVSILAVIIILCIYLLMRKKERKANARIEALNNKVNIEVARLEEVELAARQSEQRRLSRDLHDSLANEIAAISYSAETHATDLKDENEKKWLEQTILRLKRVYSIARDKSHALDGEARVGTEEAFAKRIRELADTVLPDKKYKKEIVVDDHSLEDIKVETKIELLRIIQEAIINILKHAKAGVVSVLLYREEQSLFLDIEDNGVGFNTGSAQKKKSLGLKSMEGRANSMKGKLKIISDSKGTKIHLQVPSPR